MPAVQAPSTWFPLQVANAEVDVLVELEVLVLELEVLVEVLVVLEGV